MAINKAGGADPARIQQMLESARKTGANQVSAQHGGALKQASNKGKDAAPKTEGKKVSEQSFLSEAAQKALEDEALESAQTQGRESVRDEAAIQSKGRKATKGDDDKDVAVNPGQVKQKEGIRVFPLDDDGEESYEVSETKAKQLDNLDRRTPEMILQGMPEGARKAAEATLDTQIKTKGRDKVAQLKDDPKITAVAEQMDLDPAETLQESAKIAPIRTPKDEPPMMVEDTQSEVLAKEAARRQLESGGANEAMIA